MGTSQSIADVQQPRRWAMPFGAPARTPRDEDFTHSAPRDELVGQLVGQPAGASRSARGPAR